MIFPSIFKGEHVKNTKYVTVLTGKNITVEFDRPTPLQIDGETVLGVTEYNAVAYSKVKETV
jgi:diacylglycerol kinase family enzyme